MTLLSIVQRAAAAIPVSQPQTVIDNADPTAMLLLEMAQQEGEELALRLPDGWAAQQVEYTFQTVALDAMTGTVANSGAGGVAQITGLSSTAAITELIFAASGTGIPQNAVVESVDSATAVTLNVPATQTGSGVSITFSQFAYAVPATFDRLIDGTLWDRTRYWQIRGPRSPQEWQFLKSSIFAQAAIQRWVRLVTIGGAQYLSILPVPVDDGSTLVYEYVSIGWCKDAITGDPQVLWEEDTDIGILDERLMLRGVVWRTLRRLGMAYDEEYETYQILVDKAMATDGGAQALSLDPSGGFPLIGPWSVPDGYFPGR